MTRLAALIAALDEIEPVVDRLDPNLRIRAFDELLKAAVADLEPIPPNADEVALWQDSLEAAQELRPWTQAERMAAEGLDALAATAPPSGITYPPASVDAPAVADVGPSRYVGTFTAAPGIDPVVSGLLVDGRYAPPSQAAPPGPPAASTGLPTYDDVARARQQRQG